MRGLRSREKISSSYPKTDCERQNNRRGKTPLLIFLVVADDCHPLICVFVYRFCRIVRQVNTSVRPVICINIASKRRAPRSVMQSYAAVKRHPKRHGRRIPFAFEYRRGLLVVDIIYPGRGFPLRPGKPGDTRRICYETSAYVGIYVLVF